MREFAFEMAVSASLEADTDGIVARQLGTRNRILDVVEIEPGPAFDERVAITASSIPPAVIEAPVGVGRARHWREATADGTPPDRAREAVDRAVKAGFLLEEYRGGRRYVRQTDRYPEWIGRLRGIENKPDLGRPGDLQMQLRRDVALSVFDEIVVATASHVTGAHLNRIPAAVGVWRVDPETGDREVVREPRQLPVADPGIEIRQETPTRVDIGFVGPEEKRRLRRRIAERAYGKGWRPETLPGCVHAGARGPEFRPEDTLPYCAWKGRFVEPGRECGPRCEGFDADDPPTADPDAARTRYTAFDPDPEGCRRRQVGLDRFSGDR